MPAVILGYARTPFARYGGPLADRPAVELAAAAIRAALERAAVAPDELDEVIVGQVIAAGEGQIPSRQAAFTAGVPKEIPTETVNKMCASGMRAVTLAEQLIRAGDCELVLAGGMESMSRAPYVLPRDLAGEPVERAALLDSMLHDGLVDSWDGSHMAQFGARMASEFGISREEQDRWALRSHERAVRARDGALREEIVQVGGLAADHGPRPDTSLERLAALPPVYDPAGTVTAGNASGISDGAAALVLADEAFARARGLEAIARVLGHAAVAGDQPYLATLPAEAAHKALARLGLTAGRLDRVEVNEAFASVAINVTRLLGVESDRVNVHGGAIALGHPVGASGARIVGSLALELRRVGGRGLACICSAGGQGDAIVLEAA